MSEQYILYLQLFETIICRECQYGITKDGIRLHFSRHHQMIPLKQRRELENYVLNFHVTDIKNVVTPIKEVNAVQGLKIHEGFMCTWKDCGHLRGTVPSIILHCVEEHGWIKSKGAYTVAEC